MRSPRFTEYLPGRSAPSAARAYGVLATCVGGMVLARAVEDDDLAEEILAACRAAAGRMAQE